MNIEKYFDYLKDKLEEVKIDPADTAIGEAYNDGLHTMLSYAQIALMNIRTDMMREQISKKVSA